MSEIHIKGEGIPDRDSVGGHEKHWVSGRDLKLETAWLITGDSSTLGLNDCCSHQVK